MAGLMTDDPAWRQGYAAALRDLERLVEELRSGDAASADDRRIADLALGIEHGCKRLRERLAPPRGQAANLPADAQQREWTEG